MRQDMFVRYAAALVLSAATASSAHALQLVDTFSINIGDSVSKGVPGPGAGHLEMPRSLDVYTFEVSEQTLVYFDENSGSCSIAWRCEAPDGTVLFNNNTICVTDPGSYLLDQVGEYTIEVYSNNNTTGTYGFTLWQVPPPQEFVIELGEQVSLDQPLPGAGNIEQPASVDIYRLNIESPVLAYFDEQSGSCGLRWQMHAPDGSLVFSDSAVCVTDPGSHLLDQIGEYVITVMGNQSATGSYAFQVWQVLEPDEFEIGLDQVVSLDDPGPGAGNIEQPASVDHYLLDITAPVLVYFDELSGSCSLQWRAEAPDGTVLFNNNAICVGDPGEFLLDQIGTYVISVYGNQSAVGTYSFSLVMVEDVQEFTLDVEQVVSLDVPAPGAGNIEEPGSVDQYTLSTDTPLLVYFDELSGSCGIRWQAQAPNGETLFEDSAICVTDPGLIYLDQVGDYIIRVKGNQSAVGTYSFTIWDVGEPDEFVINLGEQVSEGIPGEGAGFIEKPGRVDIYYLTVSAETRVCLQRITGPCSIRWTVQAPGGELLIDNAATCSGPVAATLQEAGEYTVIVQDAGDAVGPYSFIVNPGRAADLNDDCVVDVTDLLTLLGAWGACPLGEACSGDLNDDGQVDVADLLLLLAEWG